MSFLSSCVKHVLARLGLDVRLSRNIRAARHAEKAQRRLEGWRFLQGWSIRTVVDVGANVGQFALMMHQVLPQAAIHSFEPLDDCHSQLQEALRPVPGARTYRLALGRSAERRAINRSDFRPSSSLLVMTDAHRREWPHSAGHTRQEIEIARLDDVLPADGLEREILLKLDVQGYELEVLAGGPALLAAARGVILEVAFRDFYEGQPSFDRLYQEMRRAGFKFGGLAAQHASKLDGAVILADAIFERELPPARQE